MPEFDLIIRNATIFDGSGAPPAVGDIAIKDGRVAARGKLPGTGVREIDAAGLWLTPGLLDIHTHYDLEVELSPGLPESVRHGTTTVVVSNCSLGLAFGAQREGDQDPVVDCFARVENIPKPVLRRVADRATWTDSADYLAHLETLKLGPNIAPMIPYSMLRIAAMGTTPSVTRDPTEAEMAAMERLLEKGMREGYCGFSSDGLPFHYLSNDPNRDRRIPSQYGGYAELKRLTGIVRRFGRVWQATPPTESPLKVFRTFLLTSGRLFGKPLKITAVAALDVRSNRNIIRSAHLLARLLNSKLIGGRFYLQSLAARFLVFGDGPVTPLSEEIPALRELMKPDLEDDAARKALYEDPAFETRFKAMWRKGKTGCGLDRLKRMLRLEDWAFRRAIEEMEVADCPVAAWKGENLGAIFERLKRFQAAAPHGARGDSSFVMRANGRAPHDEGSPFLHPEERPSSGRVTKDAAREAQPTNEQDVFAGFPPVTDDADFFFHLLKIWDRRFVWKTISANVDARMVSRLTMDETFLPGFADSGAHLTNLAFYDVNLRALKIAMEAKDEAGAAFMVKRLTRDAADVFGLDAGSIEIGDQADLVLIDPKALALHDGEANTIRIWRDTLQNDQLVNRSDGVVRGVFIRGEEVFDGAAFSSVFEKKKLGRVLLAREAETAPRALAAE
jgi:N-acyl-D-aspartate/D-glutamate deacylase